MTNIATPTITHGEAELHPDLILIYFNIDNYIAEKKSSLLLKDNVM